jgi:N-acetylglucosamine kinase-like BadF-type ATPase
VQEDGTFTGQGWAEGANPYNVGAHVAAETIAETVRQAAGATTPDLVVVGAAGVGPAEFSTALSQALRPRMGGADLVLVSDAAIALEGAFPGQPGIIVIAGTGSVALGRNLQGREARAGGWGHVVDDAGSGYDIGRRVLGAVLRAHDGRGAGTALTPMVLHSLALSSPEEIEGVALRLDIAAVADLSRLALAAAGQGDGVARGIVQEAAQQLALLVRAVWERLGLAGGHAVAATGGLFSHQALADAFRGALVRVCPQARVAAPRLSPAGGALIIAFRRRGLAATGELVERLKPHAAVM